MAVPVSLHVRKIGRAPGLHPLDLAIGAGAHVAVIGPNGAGKSTLLRRLAGLDRVPGDVIWLDDKDMMSMSPRAVARRVAFLSQTDEIDAHVLVRDYIALGRLPFQGVSSAAEDAATITEAVSRCRVALFLEQPIGRLSGGERQRVLVARCLAQTPGLLLLDEPTNHLDLAARAELLALLRDLPVTVVAVLHDLTLVSAFAHRVLLLDRGRLLLDDEPDAVLTAPDTAAVFKLRAMTAMLPDGTSTLIFQPA